MLKDRSDEFYGARLIADARLHLGTVINGESSEAFFVTMCKIIDNEFYLGYKTFTNKEIKMSGVKDFIFNSNYGLGIKKATLSTFLANCAKAAVKDKTQAQCASRFARWLGQQNENFDFSQEFFEYMRIKGYLHRRYKNSEKNKKRGMYLLQKIYNQSPELLQDIGAGKKYKDIFECAQDLTIWHKEERLKPISLYKYPTVLQVQQLAEKLSERLDMAKRRVLIATMIEIYKRDREARNDKSDDDT